MKDVYLAKIGIFYYLTLCKLHNKILLYGSAKIGLGWVWVAKISLFRDAPIMNYGSNRPK